MSLYLQCIYDESTMYIDIYASVYIYVYMVYMYILELVTDPSTLPPRCHRHLPSCTAAISCFSPARLHHVQAIHARRYLRYGSSPHPPLWLPEPPLLQHERTFHIGWIHVSTDGWNVGEFAGIWHSQKLKKSPSMQVQASHILTDEITMDDLAFPKGGPFI